MDENNERVETFDDALRVAQEQLTQPEAAAENAEAAEAFAEAAEPVPEVQEETPVQQPVTQPDPQTMQMLAQMEMQNQQLMQQNQQLQSMLAELSNKNQSAVVEEALTPPVLEMSQMWSEDENVVKQKQAEYAQRMAEFTEKKLMSRLAPLLENAKYGLLEKERQEALGRLSQVPELAGIMGMAPTLEKIIESSPVLSNEGISMEDRLITAYAIAKGAEAIRNPPQQSPPPGIEDFIEMYSQNPDLQKRIEQIRAKNAAENAADVPPMSASSGYFNAALTAHEKPKDFEEAGRAVRAILGM